MRTCLLLILLTAGIAPEGVRAQFGTVTGRVLDGRTTEPVPGANVTLESDDERRGTAADEVGRFTLTNIRPGTHLLTVSHVGYARFVDTLDVSFGQRISVLVRLEPQAKEIDEVVVRADEESPTRGAGHVRVEASDLERVPMPDVTGDLAAYLLTRPGVVSAGDRGGQLFIRGGTPAQNLVLLDGMRLYQPFHIVGFYSVFPSDLVAQADVYAGGFGAQYGGRISSVVDVRSRNGNKQNVTGAASVAPFLASIHGSIPFVPGSVSLVGSARESIIERISPDILGLDLPYRFGDRFLKMHSYLSRTSSLSATLLHSFDEGNVTGGNRDDLLSSWRNTSFGGRYTYLHPEAAILTEARAYATQYASRFTPSGGVSRASDVNSYHGEMHFAYLLGALDLHFGAFGATYFLDYDLGANHSAVSENVTEVGVYTYMPWDLRKRLHVEPGIRIQTFTNGIGTAVEPRFRVRWAPGGILNGQRLSAAWGIYHQQLLGLNNQRDVTDAFFAWAPNPRFAPLPRSTHLIVGTSRPLLPNVTVSVEAFHRSVDHVSFALVGDGPSAPGPLQRVGGAARGLDFAAEMTKPGVYVFLSYSLSGVTYRYKRGQEIVRPAEDGTLRSSIQRTQETFSPPHDRRHQINVLVQTTLGPYQISGRWHFGSGLPFTPVFGYFQSPDLNPNQRDYLSVPGQRRTSFGESYSKRLPSYHRLDVSVERSFEFDRWDLIVQAGIVNAYDRANIFSYDLLLNERTDQLPLIPTVGVKVQVGD